MFDMSERKPIYLCLAHMSEEGIEQKYVKEAFDTLNEIGDAKALARWRLEKEFSDLLTYNNNYYEDEDVKFFKDLSAKYLLLTQNK